MLLNGDTKLNNAPGAVPAVPDAFGGLALPFWPPPPPLATKVPKVELPPDPAFEGPPVPTE